MKPDQDWMSVWPAQRTFHPAAVGSHLAHEVAPVAIYQGLDGVEPLMVHELE